MKHTFKLLFFSLLTILAACEKDDDDGQSNISDSIEVSIDGNLWKANITSWASSGGTFQLNSEQLSDGSWMQIFFPEDTTGIFNASDKVVTVSYETGGTRYSKNISGTVNLKRNDAEEISGTFNLKIGSFFNSDTLDFTGGSFLYRF